MKNKIKKIISPENIKTFAMLFLLACILLPYAKGCSGYVNSEGKRIERKKEKTLPTDAKLVIPYRYVLKDLDIDDSHQDWLLLLSFLWPIPIIIHRKISHRKKLKIIIWGVEPLFFLSSGWFIWFMSSFFVTPAIGAYLAISANSIYGLTWIYELIFKIKNRKKYKGVRPQSSRLITRRRQRD